ncbi:MAG: hypothetical protein ACREQM_03590 [Candidatus Dormibacteraceae bacterium]
MRRLFAVTLLLLVLQFVFGTVTNLYVSIPAHHPGAGGSGYFSQSQQSISWALAHSQPWLQLHTGLGLVLVLLALIILAVSIVTLQGRLVLAAIVGLIGIVGASGAGLAFLDYGRDLDSLLMSIGFAVAVAAYVLGLLAAPQSRTRY